MKKRRTLQEMEALMIEQSASGLSKKAFCEQQDINPATFYYWQRRLEEEQHADVGFDQLQVHASQELELYLQGGTRLVIKGKDIHQIAALVWAIDQEYA